MHTVLVASILRARIPVAAWRGLGFVITSCSVDELLLRLRRLTATDLCSVSYVADILRESPVELGSLQPYLFWDSQRYTRNLIDKTDLFELMAICWEIGQASSIHNHANQNCWMAAPMGHLLVENYHADYNGQEQGQCALKHLNTLVLSKDNPISVDPQEPVHRVVNPTEFGNRAVTLHVYSKPYQTCLTYSLQQGNYSEISLRYTSEHGRRSADRS